MRFWQPFSNPLIEKSNKDQNDLIWVEPIPSEKLRKLALQSSGYHQQLFLGSKLHCPDLKRLKEIIIKYPPPQNIKNLSQSIFFYRHEWQQLMPMMEEDHAIMDTGLSSIIPKEIMQISLFGKFHHVSSEYIYGDQQSVGSLDVIHLKIKELKKEMIKLRDNPVMIKINHSHYSLDVVVENEKQKKYLYLFGGLSLSDIKMAKNVMDFYHLPVHIAAISPNQFTYNLILNPLDH